MAFVINLTRASDRKASIIAELAGTGMPYAIVTAVDGQELDREDRRLVVPDGLATRSGNWPNVAACALSHLACYRRILDEGWAGGLVVEDDVFLPDDLVELTSQVASNVRGAELVLYGYGRKRAEEPVLLSSTSGVEVGDRALLMPVDITNVKGATTYYISAEACRRMVGRLLPVTVPADDWDFFYDQGFIDNLRCIWPRAVTSKPFPSTIGYSAGLKAAVRQSMEQTLGLRHLLDLRRQRLHEFWSETRVVSSPSPLAGTRPADWR
jgi:glycosyl transferase, family 25